MDKTNGSPGIDCKSTDSSLSLPTIAFVISLPTTYKLTLCLSTRDNKRINHNLNKG
uniref:Uncharacterized protein n=1 Tax=Arundo donax TaxID=35708 RepID=A0A0A9C215_ARUDO